MNGYLARFVNRSVLPTKVQPVVRSESPLAREDQRIGMPGFENRLQPEAPISFEEDLESASVPETFSQADDRSPGSSLVTSGVFRNRNRTFSPFANPSQSLRIESGSTSSSGNERFFSPVQAARSGVGSDATSAGITPKAAPMPDAGSDLSRKFIDRGPARKSMIIPDGNAKPSDEQGREPEEDAYSVLEPLPHRAPHQKIEQLSTSPEALRERLSLSSGPHDDAGPESSDYESPRVVIGRINVEVIPPKPEAQKIGLARSGPMTAASVSVIGPLRTGVRTNRRLSLRFR